MTFGGSVCWIVCFWWMRRISANQNVLLAQLRAQASRIERLSKAEHDLIKEVHPQVAEIKEGMDAIIATVKENSELPADQRLKESTPEPRATGR